MSMKTSIQMREDISELVKRWESEGCSLPKIMSIMSITLVAIAVEVHGPIEAFDKMRGMILIIQKQHAEEN